MPEGDSVLQLAERMQFMVGHEVTKTSVRVPRYALARFDGMECVAVWPMASISSWNSRATRTSRSFCIRT